MLLIWQLAMYSLPWIAGYFGSMFSPQVLSFSRVMTISSLLLEPPHTFHIFLIHSRCLVIDFYLLAFFFFVIGISVFSKGLLQSILLVIFKFAVQPVFKLGSGEPAYTMRQLYI